jgi:hypothetical protein
VKQFDIQHHISGARMVIYPAGTLAKRATGAYVDAPYIDVQHHSHFTDKYELVRAGRVVKRGALPFRNQQDLDETLARLVDLMKEL